MTAVALFVAVMAFGAPTVWLMMRVVRADQRKLERLRGDWEVEGREKPWRYQFPEG
jgi:hypothetical protein